MEVDALRGHGWPAGRVGFFAFARHRDTAVDDGDRRVEEVAFRDAALPLDPVALFPAVDADVVGGGQRVDGAVERFVALAAGLHPLELGAALDVLGDEALGGELLEDLGGQVAAEVDVAGAGLGDAQAAIDLGLGGVGADDPDLDAVLDALALPVDLAVAGLAEDGLAGDAAALNGEDVGVLVGTCIGVDGLGGVAAAVDVSIRARH